MIANSKSIRIVLRYCVVQCVYYHHLQLYALVWGVITDSELGLHSTFIHADAVIMLEVVNCLANNQVNQWHCVSSSYNLIMYYYFCVCKIRARSTNHHDDKILMQNPWKQKKWRKSIRYSSVNGCSGVYHPWANSFEGLTCTVENVGLLKHHSIS